MSNVISPDESVISKVNECLFLIPVREILMIELSWAEYFINVLFIAGFGVTDKMVGSKLESVISPSDINCKGEFI